MKERGMHLSDNNRFGVASGQSNVHYRNDTFAYAVCIWWFNNTCTITLKPGMILLCHSRFWLLRRIFACW